MDADREEIHLVTAAVHCLKKFEANAADPTGWLRRLQPLVSSTGNVCVGLSGWGLFENCAIVSEMDILRSASKRYCTGEYSCL
jgi:hypothetical protein